MFLFGIFLVSLAFGANAISNPIDHMFINTFDANNNDSTVPINYRLPNNTKPNTYDISLVTNVDKEDFNFTGRVVIGLEVLEENTTQITVHARQLTITRVVLRNSASTDIKTVYGEIDKTTEFLTINSTKTLGKGEKYFLTIEYAGELRKDLKGFYRSSYLANPEGKRKYLAVTQFEATDARHAFPCYDEPALKATFTIHITHGENYTAISNMKVDGAPESAGNGTVKTNFQTSELMSTYLVAFLVSDFKYSESVKDAHRVYAAPHYVEQNWTTYSVGEGVAILKAIGDYVQVNFTLPKMDQAAIPDFAAGAMENWGLVTYREDALLYNPAVHVPSRRLQVSKIISHEFGHQWFGDLVSPKWWTYIWLNEGFATIFEAIGLNAVHPDWEMWSVFVANTLQPVFRTDARPESRPMSFYTDSPAGIMNLFDGVVYAKAGSVIRMFMHVLGEDAFRKGLNYYLKNNTLSAADEAALFKDLDLAAKEAKAIPDSVNINDLFGSWSRQTGFPVLKVKRNDSGSIILTQEKYDEKPAENNTATTLWWIPFNYATGKDNLFNDTKPMGWLRQNESSIVLEFKANESTWDDKTWIVFNKQQTGYYRVLYDEKNYKLLNKELNEGNVTNIHPLNRAQILDDVNEFVRSGRLPGQSLCQTVTYLEKETSYAAWMVAKRILSEWKQNLIASDKLGKFKTVVQGLVKPYYKLYTLVENGTDTLVQQLSRNMAVSLACEFGVDDCLKETYAQFSKFLKGPDAEKPSHHLRGLIVANGIRKASDLEVEDLWKQLLNTTSIDVRQEIISSLGNMEDKFFANYLNKSITENNTLSTAERQKIITTIIGNSQKGVEEGIKFLSGNMDVVKEKEVSVLQVLNTIAYRAMKNETNTNFLALLEVAKNKTIITDVSYESLKKTAAESLAFQTNVVKKFEDEFFTEKKCSAASSFAAIPLLSIVLFCITRFNWL